jgi:Na+-translocating ferredoxin:NAD+ oxidoreductase RnfD subunit
MDWRPLRRAVRSPKGNLLLVLGGLAFVAAYAAGDSVVLPNIMNAVGAAALTDIVVQRVERKLWVFPTAGILTGLIVALILSPYDSLMIAPATAVLAICSKHLFRARLANIFNPAALALVVAAVAFDAGHSWWGALPDWSWGGALIVLLAGWYTANRINKLPLVLVFLAAFYGLFTVASFAGGPEVGSVFRAPDLQAALFFAFFMLDDPPTCPVKYRDQAIFGVIVAVVAFGAFEYFGWLYYLLAGLLAGNAWWALQRTFRARRRELRRAA